MGESWIEPPDIIEIILSRRGGAFTDITARRRGR